jgi:Fur family ferric uptake transcriptional regulator/Fur family peroxide stress response transcriptional regulator
MTTQLDTNDTALSAALHERGGRVTPQRLHVFRTLRRLDRHATAEEITRELGRDLPGISVPTVYATLELLADLGFARRVTVAKGAVLYDPHTGDHHHLVCTNCGRVEDFDTPVDTDAVFGLARRRGFAPERVELLVTGLCRDCGTMAPAHA